MRTKTIFTVLLVAFMIVSCAPAVTATPTGTIPPINTLIITQTTAPSSTSKPLPTNTLNPSIEHQIETSYPPCIMPGKSSLPTSTPDPKYPQGIKSQLDLHNGLVLREITYGHPEVFFGEGCYYSGRDDHRVRATEINLGNSYHIFITPLNDKEEMITVAKNNIETFKINVHTYTFSGLVAAWGYQDHWAIEITTLDGIDIIQDGESQKLKNNYEQVCSFQVISGKPFYFFKKSSLGYGVNYDGVEIHLDYDEIPCNDANENVDPVISRYQNMVHFFARKDGNWTEVIIGTFDQ